MTSTSILIVDDDPLVRELVKLHLGRSGHHVIQAASGQEALALIEQEAPQLILLDFAMPGLTGVDVLRTLRGNERTSQIPVVMVTAWRATPSARCPRNSGCCGCRSPSSATP